MLDYVDLFAGPGGWDLAAERLGLDGVGVEYEANACNTRRAAGLLTIEDDVRGWSPRRLPSRGLIGSPPCPTFSTAGNGEGRRALPAILKLAEMMGDGRIWGADLVSGLVGLSGLVCDEMSALVLEPLRWALEAMEAGHPYEWIALEQVPSALPVWHAIARVLTQHGYSVAVGVLHAEQYGVPQTRRRAVLIARREGPAALPVPSHSRYYPRDPERLDPGVLSWVSWGEALGWGLFDHPSPTITGGGVITGGAEPIAKWRRYTDREGFVLRGSTRPNAGVRPEDRPSSTVHFSARLRPMWVIPEDEAAAGEKLSADVLTRARAKRLTITEAGVLQTFPTRHPWSGGNGVRYQQVGNAVPPVLAGAILASALGVARDELPSTHTRAREDERVIVSAGRTGQGRPRSAGSPCGTITGRGNAYVLDSSAEWGPR